MNSFIAKKLRLAFFSALLVLAVICSLLATWLYEAKFAELIKDEFKQEQAISTELDKSFTADVSALAIQGRLLANVLENGHDSDYVSEPTPVYQVNLTDVTGVKPLQRAGQVEIQHNYSLLQSTLSSLANLTSVEQAFFAWHNKSDTFELIASESQFELPNEVLTWLALYSHQSNRLLDKAFFSPPFRIAKTDSNRNYMIYSFGSAKQQYYVLLQLKSHALRFVESSDLSAVLWHSDSGFLVYSNIEAQVNRYVLSPNPLLAVSSLPLPIQKFIIYQTPEQNKKVELTEVAGELQLVTKLGLADKSYQLLLFKSGKEVVAEAMRQASQQALFAFFSGVFALVILLVLVIRFLAEPTSKLIEFIDQQSSVFEVGKPVIPKGWFNWFEKIQISFQDNRNLLHNLTEKNKELDEKVKVRTRELIQQTISKDRNLALNRAMMNTIPDSLYYKNLSGGYLGCNKAYEELIGLTEEQLVAKTASDIFEPEKALVVEQVEQKIIASNEVHIEQETIVSKTGETRLIRWLYSAITSSQGEALGILGLGQDITEQQTSMRNLSFAAEQAEKASQVKGEFIANISHEIRTPMNSIIGMLQLLQDSTIDTSQQSYLKIAETSAQNLLSVINNILDFSKASAEKLEVESATFSISKVLESSFANSVPKAMQKGLLLDIQLPPNFPEYLQGDEVKLGQIFTNLIGNAVKFTEQGQVVVTAEVVEQTESSEQLCFYIRDTGIGIEEEQQKTVFEAFSQADSSVTRKYGGTGLGLTITCQLVELLNGSIELESQVGVGTVFKLSFEFARVQQQPKVQMVDASWLYWDHDLEVRQLLENKLSSYGLKPELLPNNEELELAQNSILLCRPETLTTLVSKVTELIESGQLKLQPVSFSYNTESRKLSQLPHLPMLTAPVSAKNIVTNAVEQSLLLSSQVSEHKAQLSGAKLLIVEDNRVNQQVLTLMLQAEGAQVVVTSNGAEAITAIKDEHFDLVLSDIQMPVMDGISLVKKLRRDKHTVPFVIVSAHTSESDVQNSISAGANEHIAKPINKAQLVKVVGDLLLQTRQAFSNQLTKQVNVDFLLEQFNQSVPIAKKVLTSFANSQQQDFEQFCLQALELEFDAIKHKVHSYKGMLGNIGAESAHQASIEFERKLLAKEQTDEEDLLHWQHALNQLFDAIEQLK